MKKRFIALLLCAVLTISGCSGGDTANQSETGSDTSQTTVQTTTEVTSATTSDTEETAQASSETEVTSVTTTEAAETAQTTPKTEKTEQTTTTKAKETEQTTAEPEKTKSLTAMQVAENMGVGLNLGNTMEAYLATDCEKVTYKWIPTAGDNDPTDYETCWGAVVTTQKVIDGIKAAGFDTVRIPVFWGNMMKNDGTYTINSEYIARVKEIVDYCEKAGLYSVINIHHFDEFIIRRNSLDNCEKIFTKLWKQIAEYFKDYPYTVIFEGYNEYLGGKQFDKSGNLVEPSKTDGYKMTNTLNQTFVDAVRATGGNNAERVLIVSGYWTNIDLTTKTSFKMPTDTVKNRLMVSVHYVDNNMFWWNSIGNKDWEKYIDDQCAMLKKAFTDKNIPVFLGETTAIYPKERFAGNATYKTSTECLSVVLNKLLDHGFVPVIWDVNDNFYSRTTYKIKSATDRELILSLSK